jgi:RsiG-like
VDDIVDLVSRSDEELRDLIAQFEAEEKEISRKRRILHAKIDILRAELVMRLQQGREEGKSLISSNDLERLTQILAGRGPGGRDSGGLTESLEKERAKADKEE